MTAQGQLKGLHINEPLNTPTHSELGFLELFPVQSAVWRELAGGLSSAHDLCIAAPTGSGKTLAYALPIINGLARWATATTRPPLCT